MLNTLEKIKELPWTKGVPLVCDRAMGKTSLLQKMHGMGITFLTALTRHEYTNYAGALAKSRIVFPLKGLSEKEIAAIARLMIATNTDFAKVSDDLFAIDLGAMEVSVLGKNSDFRAHMKYLGNRIQTAMYLGREIKRLVDLGVFGSIIAAGKSLKLKPGLASKYYHLNRLPEQVQAAILNGEACNCSINRIDEIALMDNPADMFEKFYEHVDKSNKAPKKTKRQYRQTEDIHSRNKAVPTGETIFKVRVVAYFNPQMYADQKDRAQRWLQKIENFEVDLNKRLSSNDSRRTKGSVYAEIDRFIRKKDLLRCFDIKINQGSTSNTHSLNFKLTLKEEEWNKRRDFDGFCVLVAHPDCNLTAAELCKLNRTKDIVEKDFQVIKSVLQVGPIRHRTDLKVKAHLTVCMLSLLIERLLEKKLAGKFSARQAMEMLHACHLNKYIVGDESLYTITELNTQQQAILKQLHMTHLSNDDYLLERIVKR